MLDNSMQIEKQEATEYKPFPNDIYSVELLDVNSKEVETYDSKQERAKGERDVAIMETVFDFQFVLLEGKDGDAELRGRNIFQNFTPSYLYISGKGKNKLYQVFEALQGSDLSPQQEAEGISGADINSLIGKQCRVGTVQKVSGEKTYSNIDKFYTAKGDFAPLTSQEKEDAKIKPKEDTAPVEVPAGATE